MFDTLPCHVIVCRRSAAACTGVYTSSVTHSARASKQSTWTCPSRWKHVTHKPLSSTHGGLSITGTVHIVCNIIDSDLRQTMVLSDSYLALCSYDVIVYWCVRCWRQIRAASCAVLAVAPHRVQHAAVSGRPQGNGQVNTKHVTNTRKRRFQGNQHLSTSLTPQILVVNIRLRFTTIIKVLLKMRYQ